MTIVRSITILGNSVDEVTTRLQKAINEIEETEDLNCISITFFTTGAIPNPNASGPWDAELPTSAFIVSFNSNSL